MILINTYSYRTIYIYFFLDKEWRNSWKRSHKYRGNYAIGEICNTCHESDRTLSTNW